jgi:hypothetical protein
MRGVKMSNQLPFPKPVKKEKVERWGVYRKYPKAIIKPIVETVKETHRFNKTLKKVGKLTKQIKKKQKVERKILISPLFIKGIGLDEYEFLFTEYYPGIAKISPELYIEVKTRSKKCEICGKRPALFIHHLLIGRLRISWTGNLMNLCDECHDKDGSREAIHHNKDVYEREMKKLQDLYFSMGFNKEQVIWLLGTKSGRLF